MLSDGVKFSIILIARPFPPLAVTSHEVPAKPGVSPSKFIKLLGHRGHEERKGLGCPRAGSEQRIHPRTPRLPPPLTSARARFPSRAVTANRAADPGPGLHPGSPLGRRGGPGGVRSGGDAGAGRGPRPPQLRQREGGAPASARQVAPEPRPPGGCGGAGAPAAPARCEGGGAERPEQPAGRAGGGCGGSACRVPGRP